MRSISEELKSITVGDPTHFGNLTIFPLLRPCPEREHPGYLLLDEAIAQGTARVTELGGGSVPEICFENRAEMPVLLLDGEELIGAKQNRTVNLTVLAPAKQTIVIPVSCVEAGRWRMEALDFQPARHVMYSRVRAARAAQVTCSMATSGSRRSDQSAVWEEIAANSERLGGASPTQAMSALYDRHAISIEAYLRAFAWTERQAGLLFGIGRQTLGLDLLDHPETMRKFFSKLLRSYALDAVEAAHSTPVRAADASAFLAGIAQCSPISQPAVGVGKDLRFAGQGVSGGALWADERYIHLCGFTQDVSREAGSFQSRISRPARRRAI